MILYLTSKKLPKLFSTEVIPFYIPTSYVWFKFLHLLTNTCYFLCLYSFGTYIVEHLAGTRPVLGLRGAGELDLWLFWQSQGDTDIEQWQLVVSEGVTGGPTCEGQAGQASDVTFMPWPPVPALAPFPALLPLGGVMVRCQMPWCCLSEDSPPCPSFTR